MTRSQGNPAPQHIEKKAISWRSSLCIGDILLNSITIITDSLAIVYIISKGFCFKDCCLTILIKQYLCWKLLFLLKLTKNSTYIITSVKWGLLKSTSQGQSIWNSESNRHSGSSFTETLTLNRMHR